MWRECLRTCVRPSVPPGPSVLRPILPRVLCLFSRTIKVEVYDWDRDGR